jgi:hypothetical protein
MLRNFSKIKRPVEAIKTGPIVLWKEEKETLYYVKEILVDFC